MFAFGYGLSYSQFVYGSGRGDPHDILSVSHVAANASQSVAIDVYVQVTNVGGVDADEVVQLYVSVLPFRDAPGQQVLDDLPRVELKAFERVRVGQGDTRAVEGLRLETEGLKLMDDRGEMRLLQGVYVVHVGGSAPGSRGAFVDGEDHHATVLPWSAPAACGGGTGKAGQGERTWRGVKRVERGLAVTASIAGRLVGSFTVC